MHLLARFYDPNRGTVRIDGVDLKEVNPRKLRRQMAWVTQDSQLFQGTLWENIAYGSRNATDQQIMQAAKIARLPDFVDTFQNGYQTIVGDDGGQLSAGQRQRVALARAIVADPRIFILDEATSQIDGKTEGLIHDELAEFIKSRTTIIITHRRSSLSLADRVVVMQRGRIVHDSSVANADKDSLQFQNLFARSA
jgi:ABC-type multidrug transport system fused ATPase/permease subunit